MFYFFKRISVLALRQDQLYEAERHLLEYQASAEYYAGLAAIYQGRVMRLRGESDAEKAHGITAAPQGKV